MNAYKKIIIKIGLGLLAILLVFTIAARSINNMLLPIVTGVFVDNNAAKGYIQSEVFANGVFKNDDESQDNENILAGDNWIIKTVHFKKGDQVKKGDKLFTLDIKEAQIRLKQLESSLQEQKNRVNSADLTGGDMLVLRQQLDAKQMEYDQANASFPHSGIIKAPQNGVITQLAAQGSVLRGEKLCTFANEETQNSLQFSVSIAVAKTILSKNIKLNAEYTLIDATSFAKIEECNEKIEVNKVEYISQTGLYTIYAAPIEGKIIPQGTPARITGTVKSKEYPAVLPLACVFTDDKGDKFVYKLQSKEGVFGNSFFVQRMNIQVLESDFKNAAITSSQSISNCTFVSYPSKPIKDGETVRVVGKNA